MNKKKIIFSIAVFMVILAAVFTLYRNSIAHCDTLDGPVVLAAKDALETGNVNLVLIWVQKENEAELKQAYDEALKLRNSNPELKEHTDTHFFETVVKLHREGEGEPFTGLKAAGTDLGLAIPAGDKAIVDGSTAKLEDLLVETLKEGLKEKFTEVNEKMKYDKNNVDAGREYVKAYVEYMHYIENLYKAAGSQGHAHSKEKTEEHKCDHNKHK
ncbi:MAG: hypothetical protein EHM58_11545 [Ignavibacteriae bacterium]|nr:MAG: hypothetical protein EHM58_11545 [Ignavibacteriota bacterium]